MATNRAQQVPHLRCRDCDGWGWKPYKGFLSGEQLGEDTCPSCGGSGNKEDEEAEQDDEVVDLR